MSKRSHRPQHSSPLPSSSPVHLCLRSSVSGDGPSSVFPLEKRVTRIGRLDDNDIVIAGDEISDFHALFQRTQDGGFEVIDQDSRRGLFINGRREKRARVKPGDVILFGDVEAVLEEPSSNASPSPQTPAPAAATEPMHAPASKAQPASPAPPTAPDPAAPLALLQQDLNAAREEINSLRTRLADAKKSPLQSSPEPREGGLLGLSFFSPDRKAKKLDALEASLAERSAQLKELNNTLAQSRRDLDRIDPLRREVQDLEARHQSLLREKGELEQAMGRLSTSEQDLLELKGSEDKLRKSRERLESWVRSLEKDRETLEKEVADLQQVAQEARSARDEARAHRDEFLLEQDRLASALEAIRAEQEQSDLAIRNLEEKLRAATAEFSSRQEDLKSTRQELLETQDAAAHAAAVLQEKLREHESLTRDSQAMREELAAFTQDRKTRKSDLSALQDALAGHQAALLEMETTISTTSERLTAISQQAAAEDSRLSSLRSQTSDQKSVLSQLRDMANETHALKEGLELQAAGLQDRLAELSEAKHKLEARLVGLGEGLRTKETLLTETEGLVQDAAAQLETSHRQIADREEKLGLLQEQVRETGASLEELHAEVKASTIERNQLEAEINRFQQQIRAIEDRRASLETDLAELQEQLREREDQSLASGRRLEELNDAVERAQADAAQAQLFFEQESAKLAALRENCAEQKTVLETLRVDTVDARKDLAQLGTEKQALLEHIDSLESKRESLEDHCSSLDADRKKRQEDLQNLDDEFLALRETVAKVQREAAAQTAQFEEEQRHFLERITAAEEELILCQNERQEEASRTLKLQEEGRLARKNLEESSASLAQQQDHLRQLERQSQALQDQIGSLQAAKRQIAAERDAAGAELQDLRAHAGESAARLAELRSLVDSRESDLARLQSELLAQREAAEKDSLSHQAGLQVLQGRLREGELTARSVAAEVAAERRRLEDLKRDAQIEVDRLQLTQKRLDESITSRTEELTTLDSSLRERRAHLEETRSGQEALLAGHQAKLDQLLARRKVAEDDLSAKFAQIEAANASLEETGAAKRHLAEIRASQERSQEDLTKVLSQLEKSRAEEDKLARQVAGLHQRTAELERLDAEAAAKEAEVKRHEERARLLQERRTQMERSLNLETGTLHAFAADLIKRIDPLDDLILSLGTAPAQQPLLAPLHTLRQSLLDTLEDYSVLHYEYPTDAKIDPVERQLVHIVEARSDRPKKVTRVVETVRRGYRHVAPNGAQTILRKASIITTHP